MFGLIGHMPATRRVVAPLRKRSRSRELLPVDSEVVEPLATEVVIRVLNVLCVGRNGQVAPLRCGKVRIG